MTVNPPKTWGKITGTVTGPSGPIAGRDRPDQQLGHAATR